MITYDYTRDAWTIQYEEGAPDEELSNEQPPPETDFAVLASLDVIPNYAGSGIVWQVGDQFSYWLARVSEDPDPKEGVHVVVTDRPITLRIVYDEAASVIFTDFSFDGLVWSDGPEIITPVAPTEVGIVLLADAETPILPITVISQYRLITNPPPQIPAETTVGVQTLGATQQLGINPLVTGSEPLIHTIIGAQYADLEVDVGKSVKWLEFFSDTMHITDVNMGEQRYWVISWDYSFPGAKHNVSGLDYFYSPTIAAQWRQEQFDIAAKAWNYADSDWTLWIDSSEGLSFDLRSLPDDYNAEMFKSWIWREITRATERGHDIVYLPLFAHLKHSDTQNVYYKIMVGDQPSISVSQAISVPWYLPAGYLARLIKVSALRSPTFNWSILDQLETAPPEGVTSYIRPEIGTVTTPDPGLPPSESIYIAKLRGPTAVAGVSTPSETLVAQYEVDPNRAFVLRRTPATGTFIWNATNTGLAAGGNSISVTSATPTLNADAWLAIAVDYDIGGGNMQVTAHRSTDGKNWTQTGQTSGVSRYPFDSTSVLRIGGYGTANFEKWFGRIYWVEHRTGLSPTAGTLLWRYDTAEIPSSASVAPLLSHTLTADSNADGIADNWKATAAGSPNPAGTRTMVSGHQRITATFTTTGQSYGIESVSKIPVTVGKNYTLTMRAEATNTSAVAGLMALFIYWFNSSSAFLTSSTFAVAAGAPLTEWSMTAVAPANAAFASMVMRLNNGTTPTGTTTMDIYDARISEEITYTDPRGRPWTVMAAHSVTPVSPVAAVKSQVISYAYAHWNPQDVPPGQTQVPALDATNDWGWEMRQKISKVRPLTGVPYTDPWKDPSTDPVSQPGPWGVGVVRNTHPTFVYEADTIPQPTTATAGVCVPLYDTVMRLNLRDGLFYQQGVSGNIPLYWDATTQTWLPEYDPDTWPAYGVGAAWIPPPGLAPMSLRLDGGAGTYTKTADSPLFDYQYAFTIVAVVSFDDWSPATRKVIASKWNPPSQCSYYWALEDDNFVLVVSRNGSTPIEYSAVHGQSFIDGKAYAIAVAFNTDITLPPEGFGTEADQTRFWLFDDTTNTWSVVATVLDDNAGYLPLFDSTAELQVGAYQGNQGNAASLYHWVSIRQGVGDDNTFGGNEMALMRGDIQQDPSQDRYGNIWDNFGNCSYVNMVDPPL